MIKRGMEVGCLAIIDVKQNTAYHFEAVQTPPVKKSESETGLESTIENILRRINLMKHSKILVEMGGSIRKILWTQSNWD